MSDRMERVVWGIGGILLGLAFMPISSRLHIPEGTMGCVLVVLTGLGVLASSFKY